MRHLTRLEAEKVTVDEMASEEREEICDLAEKIKENFLSKLETTHTETERDWFFGTMENVPCHWKTEHVGQTVDDMNQRLDDNWMKKLVTTFTIASEEVYDIVFDALKNEYILMDICLKLAVRRVLESNPNPVVEKRIYPHKVVGMGVKQQGREVFKTSGIIAIFKLSSHDAVWGKTIYPF